MMTNVLSLEMEKCKYARVACSLIQSIVCILSYDDLQGIPYSPNIRPGEVYRK